MLRHCIATCASITLLGCQAEPACKSGLVADLVEAGRHSRLANLNLTPVAQRHIPIGSPIQTALERLKATDLTAVEVSEAFRTNQRAERQYMATADADNCAAIGGYRFVLVVSEKRGIVADITATRFGQTMP